MKDFVAECKPLLQEWARINGVKIEHYRSWNEGGTRRCKAWGQDAHGALRHHTIIAPDEVT